MNKFTEWLIRKYNDKGLYVCPPMEAQEALDFLSRYLIKDTRIVASSSSSKSNTEIVHQILTLYSPEYRKEMKALGSGVVALRGAKRSLFPVPEVVEDPEEKSRLLHDKLNKDKHGVWQINCDGYYPYCPFCGYEPEWTGKENRASTCKRCGATLDKESKSSPKVALTYHMYVHEDKGEGHQYHPSEAILSDAVVLMIDEGESNEAVESILLNKEKVKKYDEYVRTFYCEEKGRPNFTIHPTRIVAIRNDTIVVETKTSTSDNN